MDADGRELLGAEGEADAIDHGGQVPVGEVRVAQRRAERGEVHGG